MRQHNSRALALVRIRERRSWLYKCGIFRLTLPRLPLLSDEPLHQSGKLQKIRHPEECATLADDDLGIGRDDIRPLPRYRADAIVVDAQQEPRAVPVVPLAYADQLPPAERVERVRHSHKTRRCVGRACILS